MESNSLILVPSFSYNYNHESPPIPCVLLKTECKNSYVLVPHVLKKRGAVLFKASSIFGKILVL